ncbi:unnamed protein product [Pleuronectes platessa]|uniref:Uncharacterized protein n=1 Tax=Pleuronectes platessa TaxID=8262 RepID=A0A9N7VIW0_PLEPL|nr:unnamed protein product [Pleuronectes platessa]
MAADLKELIDDATTTLERNSALAVRYETFNKSLIQDTITALGPEVSQVVPSCSRNTLDTVSSAPPRNIKMKCSSASDRKALYSQTAARINTFDVISARLAGTSGLEMQLVSTLCAVPLESVDFVLCLCANNDHSQCVLMDSHWLPGADSVKAELQIKEAAFPSDDAVKSNLRVIPSRCNQGCGL